MKRAASTFMTAAVVFLLFAVAASPSTQTRPARSASHPPCTDIEKASYKAGWDAAFSAGKKTGYEEGFKNGIDTAFVLFGIDTKADGSKQKVNILVEQISGADAYRFAAADVIRVHFSDWLLVDPSAPLTLHITGTDPMTVGYGDVQSLDVSLKAVATQMIRAGNDSRMLVGLFEVSRTGSTLKDYSHERKVQFIKEAVYRVLSDYRASWTKAGTKAAAQ